MPSFSIKKASKSLSSIAMKFKAPSSFGVTDSNFKSSIKNSFAFIFYPKKVLYNKLRAKYSIIIAEIILIIKTTFALKT